MAAELITLSGDSGCLTCMQDEFLGMDYGDQFLGMDYEYGLGASRLSRLRKKVRSSKVARKLNIKDIKAKVIKAVGRAIRPLVSKMIKRAGNSILSKKTENAIITSATAAGAAIGAAISKTAGPPIGGAAAASIAKGMLTVAKRQVRKKLEQAEKKITATSSAAKSTVSRSPSRIKMKAPLSKKQLMKKNIRVAPGSNEMVETEEKAKSNTGLKLGLGTVGVLAALKFLG